MMVKAGTLLTSENTDDSLAGSSAAHRKAWREATAASNAARQFAVQAQKRYWLMIAQYHAVLRIKAPMSTDTQPASIERQADVPPDGTPEFTSSSLENDTV